MGIFCAWLCACLYVRTNHFLCVAVAKSETGRIERWYKGERDQIGDRALFTVLIFCRKDVGLSPNTSQSGEKNWAALLPCVISSSGWCGGWLWMHGSHLKVSHWAFLWCILIKRKLPREEFPVKGQLCIILETGRFNTRLNWTLTYMVLGGCF